MADREGFPNIYVPPYYNEHGHGVQNEEEVSIVAAQSLEDYIYLGLDSNMHDMEDFIVKCNEPMINLKRLHLSRLSESEKEIYKIYFICNAQLIEDNDTPQSLGLEDNDIVHVIHTKGEGIRYILVLETCIHER